MSTTRSSTFFGNSSLNVGSTYTSSNQGLGARLWSSVTAASNSLGSTIPVLAFFTFLLISVVIVYLVYKVRRYSLKTVDLMGSTPVIQANPMAGEHRTFLGGRLPELKNGGEFSYSIWIYIENITITSDYKIIMYRGNSAGYVNGSTYVYMDPNTNKLYVTLRTNGNPEVADRDGKVNLQQIKNNEYLMHGYIDYVPVQRWVHVCFAVRDAVMYLYFDGELYSVNTVYDLRARSDGSRPMITRPVGDVFMGGKADREGINGYLARAQFMNFGVSLQQAKQIYNEGPYKRNMLSYVGIENVGVRNPFYFTDPDEVAANKCDNNAAA